MKVFSAALSISLLSAAIATQFAQRAFPGNYVMLLLLAFVGTTIACLVTLRVYQRMVAEEEEQGLYGFKSKAQQDRARRKLQAQLNKEEEPEREDGTVKWFNRSKGFGFIIRGNGEEIFVHHRSIRSEDGRRASLRDGQPVTYVVVERAKGWQAEDVVPA